MHPALEGVIAPFAPPPVEWSALRYGLRADRGRIRWERSGTSLRRSSPSCGKWTCWSRRVGAWRRRSARSASPRSAERRTAEWRDFLHAAGGQSCDRELATALQQRAASCFSGLPAAGSGAVRARLRSLAACAHPTSSAGQAARGEKANAELTSNPHHPMGADQPGLVAVALFTFIIAWNSYVWALVLTTTPSMFVISVGITNLVGEYRVQWNELMAAATVGALPVMVLYAFLNRHLVSAITAGAVKA